MYRAVTVQFFVWSAGLTKYLDDRLPTIEIDGVLHIDHGYYAARERQCGPEKSPKYRYGSEREARDAADRARRRTGAKMSCYRCRFCSWWHIGHKKEGA